MVASSLDAAEVSRSVDQHVVLYGISWDQYEALLAARGESAVPRMSYLKGALELMSPSQDHETIKTTLARLIEAYAEELGLELEGYGSWTLKRSRDERGLEPDECYSRDVDKDIPDIAIEVVITHGSLDKLDVYRGLGVREVWVFEGVGMQVFTLRESGLCKVREGVTSIEEVVRETVK